MKKSTRILDIKEGNTVSLKKKLLHKLEEYFNLRMQLKSGQFKKVNILKMMRRGIASIKYYLSKK